jgi:hypothetical protein
MDELPLNGAQVAVLAGTTAQTVSKVRSGELIPRDHLRVMLALALGTTPETLFQLPSLRDVERAVLKRPRRHRKAAA